MRLVSQSIEIRVKLCLMSIHSLDKDQVEGIEVKNSVRCLGILINKPLNDRILDHFSKWIQKSYSSVIQNGSKAERIVLAAPSIVQACICICTMHYFE